MGKRVLIVDDEPDTVRVLQVALQRDGWEVTTAANGAEGLLKVASTLPDVVILDLNMPVLDGFETLRVLRERPETAELPVLMLTARAEDRDVWQGWTSGVDLYLTKPFSPDEVVAAARRLAGEKTES